MTTHTTSPITNSSESTSGTTYVQHQVTVKGYPSPQSGGKKRQCRKCKKSHKMCHCGSKSMRKRRRSRSSKKGGFLQQALVPFGLFSLQKRTQKRRSAKAHGKSHKKYRSSRRSRSSRR